MIANRTAYNVRYNDRLLSVIAVVSMSNYLSTDSNWYAFGAHQLFHHLCKRHILQQKCHRKSPARNTMAQLLTLQGPHRLLSATIHIVTDRQTDNGVVSIANYTACSTIIIIIIVVVVLIIITTIWIFSGDEITKLLLGPQ